VSFSEAERIRQHSFEWHKNHPDVSLEEHVRQKQIELGKKLDQKIAVYLDIKYWIILCEVALYRNISSLEVELLERLKSMVRKGIIFCPICETTFIELMKQDDLMTRKATAGIIDELSSGVTLIPFDLRVGTELAHFLYSNQNPENVYPLSWLVWSRPSYILGHSHPTNTAFDPVTELIIQKSFFDYMWTLSLTEMIETIGLAPAPSLEGFSSLASTLNEKNALHADELLSYKQTYLQEISGGISLFVDRAVDILHSMAIQAGINNKISDDERAQTERMLQNLFVEAYRKGKINRQVPTLNIYATCHASVRWNKGFQFEANDFFDFHHATAALGHCQAFFTERSLFSLLTSKHVALDSFYNCKVFHKVQDAVDYLKSIDG
jgi:hypothetical protein